ncbi:hypothetical protein CHARACLAT_033295 [Characodon lateralis]|uniref:Uncharacterized protein n=1 Tax=Characodon lateralis TaxID=208331 RepID=A0ABU7CTG6_9TELE|nr:hypothetical protein [Characodon lateralis]
MRGVRSKKRLGDTKSDGQARTDPANDENKPSMMQATKTRGEGELTTAKAIQNLSNNIKEMQNEVITLRNDIKQDLSSFKREMNKKLEEVSTDIRNHGSRLTEAEQRLNKLETVNVDLKEPLISCLKQQKTLKYLNTSLNTRTSRRFSKKK